MQYEYCSETDLRPSEIRAALNGNDESGWQPWRVDVANVQWFRREKLNAGHTQEIHGIPPERGSNAELSRVEFIGADDADDFEDDDEI